MGPATTVTIEVAEALGMHAGLSLMRDPTRDRALIGGSRVSLGQLR
jgi:hypothetical protein